METRREWESERPSKKKVHSDSYAELAEMPVPKEILRNLKLKLTEGTTFADAMVMALYVAAINGNVAAARELREAIEGKVGERPKEVPENVILHVVHDQEESKNSDELTSETKAPEES